MILGRRAKTMYPKDRYGLLVITGRAKRVEGSDYIWWECLCDCGKYTWVRGTALRQGVTRSCGRHPVTVTGELSHNYRHGHCSKAHHVQS